MAREKQLDLLAARPSAWLESLKQRVAAWAQRSVYFGGSSWKYEGWLGQIYSRDRYLARGKFSKTMFEKHCLEEYSEIFPTVCGDFSFYDFYSDAFWRALFAQVPPSFQFGFKAPEQITCPAFPNHPRYGARAGQRNDDFLNADLFVEQFVSRLEPHRRQVGYIVLEFPQFHRATPATNAKFLERLDAFLARLPKTLPYAVEIRTEKLLGSDYFACLRRHGVGHVFNSWTRMPAIGEQLNLDGAFTADTIVARVLLRPGRTYEDAVALFQPYDQIKDPNPDGYREIVELVQTGTRDAKKKVYVAVNNRYAGNAPSVIDAILGLLG